MSGSHVWILVPPYVPATFDQKRPPVPPPVYQEGEIPMQNLPGQTYYQPPPQPELCSPPLIYEEPPQQQPMRSRVVGYYSPPDNYRLGLKRRLTTLFCGLLILALVIALIAGFSRHYNQSPTYCEWYKKNFFFLLLMGLLNSRFFSYSRTDSDCVSLYGNNFIIREPYPL